MSTAQLICDVRQKSLQPNRIVFSRVKILDHSIHDTVQTMKTVDYLAHEISLCRKQCHVLIEANHPVERGRKKVVIAQKPLTFHPIPAQRVKIGLHAAFFFAGSQVFKDAIPIALDERDCRICTSNQAFQTSVGARSA